MYLYDDKVSAVIYYRWVTGSDSCWLFASGSAAAPLVRSAMSPDGEWGLAASPFRELGGFAGGVPVKTNRQDEVII